jgi:hypothetical protein
MAFRGGVFADLTSAAAATAAAVLGVKDAEVWIHSADFVGTFNVQISHDDGVTYGTMASTVVASGVTNTKVLVPSSSKIRVAVSAYTSGTLSSAWSGTDEADIGR